MSEEQASLERSIDLENQELELDRIAVVDGRQRVERRLDLTDSPPPPAF